MSLYKNIPKQTEHEKSTPYFVEWEGENRCGRCCYCYNDKLCKRAKCTPEERKDGKRGYYRDPSPAEARTFSINMTM